MGANEISGEDLLPVGLCERVGQFGSLTESMSEDIIQSKTSDPRMSVELENSHRG